jgi:hypothetical protein
MPFPYIGDLVPAVGKVISNGSFMQREHTVIRVASNLCGVFARLDTSSRRATHGLTGEGILKTNPLARHAIEVRRYIQRLSIAAARVPSLLVAKKENDIRSVHVSDIPERQASASRNRPSPKARSVPLARSVKRVLRHQFTPAVPDTLHALAY